ncbi:MAG: Holliday junction resolvase RuvX [Clostridia bacterium]|nr:Holliday junction resolvase RuvX [Clostridia bacterium]
MRILGIDYGEARTGLAVGDTDTNIATVIGTIHERNKTVLAEKIAKICTDEKIEKLVFGLPKNMDGTEGFRAEYTRLFAATLNKLCPELPIDFYDERLSTVAASRFMMEANTKGKKKKNSIDALSAQIILQDYLELKKSLL